MSDKCLNISHTLRQGTSSSQVPRSQTSACPVARGSCFASTSDLSEAPKVPVTHSTICVCWRNSSVNNKQHDRASSPSLCRTTQLWGATGLNPRTGKKSRILHPELLVLFPESPDVVRIVITTVCSVWPQRAPPPSYMCLSIVRDLFSSFQNGLLLCCQLIPFKIRKVLPLNRKQEPVDFSHYILPQFNNTKLLYFIK